MNSTQLHLTALLAAAFLGFAFAATAAAAAEGDFPQATVNISSNSDQKSQGENYTVTCDYTVHKPSTSDDSWQLTVAFHKEIMAMNSEERFPVVAKYQQHGPEKQMVFESGRPVAGMKVRPADGKVITGMESPKRVEVVPPVDDSTGMFLQGMWKCSVTLQQKKGGTGAEVRFMSKGHMATSRPSSS